MIPGTPVIGGGATPLGYQQISAATLATATALTIPAGASVALVSVDTAAVRWRDDGTAPTTSIGMQLIGTATLSPTLAFAGASMAAVKFILVGAGSPILNVSYY
jgi:hypothetical protein